MATDYDDIADQYQQTKVNPIKKYSEEFTFFQVLGDVCDQAVLDLACGDGYYTRAMRRRGAAPVVGVDVSREMIHQAKQIEVEEPLEIEYRVDDVANLGAIGVFDLLTAVYLLQYAASETELQQMADTFYQNLKTGGRFVTITGQPDLTPAHMAAQAGYGVTITPQGPLKDGVSIQNTITVPEGEVQFTNYHWSRATYEHIFKRAGFSRLTWHPMQISADGTALYPPDFWQAFREYPAITILAGYK